MKRTHDADSNSDKESKKQKIYDPKLIYKYVNPFVVSEPQNGMTEKQSKQWFKYDGKKWTLTAERTSALMYPRKKTYSYYPFENKSTESDTDRYKNWKYRSKMIKYLEETNREDTD